MAAEQTQVALVRKSRKSDFLSEHLDHHVDMVAVNAVDSHAQSVSHRLLELDVPREGKYSETVTQCDTAAVPFRVMQVQNVHSLLGKTCQVSFKARRQPINAG